MKLKKLLCLFIVLKAIPSYSCQRDTVRLFFDINKKDILPRHKITLDSLSNRISDTTTVRIFGFADYLGKRNPNYQLSKDRAETVKAYLQSRHSSNARIVADAKGQVDAATKNVTILGEPFNRRVDIIIAQPIIEKSVISKSAPPVNTAIARIKEPRYIKRDIPEVKKSDDSVYARIKDLPKLNVGDSVSFKELTFQPGRHFLRPSAVYYMVALKDCLKANPNLKIEIQGHICCQFDGKDGLDFDTKKNNLSVTRAKYIYDYLRDEGITADRLRYKGLGSKEPKIYPEMSADDQYQNRRVVIVLLGK